MVMVGGVVAWGAQLPLSAALVFGALIAATDPVVVVAIFRKLGAPKRLEVLLEGESLLNDGTAIILFGLALTAAQGSGYGLGQAIGDFLLLGVGGLLVGVSLGWLVSQLIARIDDYLIETTLTTVLAFGAYLTAERFHLSGVLAVVAAGIVCGNVGPRGMSPTTRIVVFNFWEYIAFLANSAVFLLIGLHIDLTVLAAAWRPILWAIAAVLVSRAITTYLVSGLAARLPVNWRHVLFWGGPRGAIALALALSLPATLGPARETIATMTFGVVLFSILVQGMSMDWLVRRLKLVVLTSERAEYERRHARALAARAGQDRLQRLHRDGLISSPTWDAIRPIAEERVRALTAAVQDALREAPGLGHGELLMAWRESLRAQRTLIARLRRDGLISESVHDELVSEIDLGLQTGELPWMREVTSVDIRYLLFAVIHGGDLETATDRLSTKGLLVTRIQSWGGFLTQPNHMLLIGVPETGLDEAMQTLQMACHTRVEYIPPPFESMPGPIGPPIPVEVRGATAFAFRVERYEEL
jgi:CPA1 family monovalent cation:H+ antiporter